VDWFLETARQARSFALGVGTGTKSLLTRLNQVEGGVPTNSAVLLFGRDPQKFHQPALVKCIQCEGSTYQRPFTDITDYGGSLCEQADKARRFVLDRIRSAVGTRLESNVAGAEYELPPDAISESIINALSHKNYNSKASVEVRLFPDRLEVWNPGRLPGNLSVEALREDHPSVPNNPLIAESLYLAGYIERVGSGTQMMIEKCRQAGLPEPDFEQRQGSFVVTLWRDWFTDALVGQLGIKDRQKRAIEILRTESRLTSARYQTEAAVSRQTATRDLDDLVTKGIAERHGERRGTFYTLARRMPQL
jgi:predicted HTH transcriptional regulator